MTQVDVDLSKPTQDGDGTPAAGTLECRPTARRVVGDGIVLPDSFTAKLVNGLATLELAPNDAGTWCWVITERANRGSQRHVNVPASGPVNYSDLVDVDPTTLDPTTPVAPAYQALLDAKADSADLGTAAAQDVGAFATAAQGTKADAAIPLPDSPSDGQLLKWDNTAGAWVPVNPVGNSRNASAKNATGTITQFNPGASGGVGAEVTIPSTGISVTNSGGRSVVLKINLSLIQTVTGNGVLLLYVKETTGSPTNYATLTVRLPGTSTVGSYTQVCAEVDLGPVTTTRTFDLRGQLYTAGSVVPVLQALNSVTSPTWFRAVNE